MNNNNIHNRILLNYLLCDAILKQKPYDILYSS